MESRRHQNKQFKNRSDSSTPRFQTGPREFERRGERQGRDFENRYQDRPYRGSSENSFASELNYDSSDYDYSDRDPNSAHSGWSTESDRTYGENKEWRSPQERRYRMQDQDRMNEDRYRTRDFIRDSERSHFGKGPKGYQRSDDRIKEDVSEAFYRHPRIDASDIEVAVKSGTVTLRGIVEDRQTKRLAEDVAENITGVLNVSNMLTVSHKGLAFQNPMTSSSSSTGSRKKSVQ